jgi:hypothetical protein
MDKSRLRMFEKSVLRRLLGSKMGEVTGVWREVHNEWLNELYCSPNVIQERKIKWVGHVARIG